MSEKTTVKILLMRGVEGKSLYIDDFRIAGPKPWGGGTVEKEWVAERRDIAQALGTRPAPDPDLLEACKESWALLQEVADMNIQPFPVRAVALNNQLRKIITKATNKP